MYVEIEAAVQRVHWGSPYQISNVTGRILDKNNGFFLWKSKLRMRWEFGV
jgi:hypothetical protein